MKHWFLFLAVWMSVALLGCSPETKEAPTEVPEPPKAESQANQRVFPLSVLATMPVEVGVAKFEAFVMDTDEKRQEGLMWVTEADLGDKAMLFVFPEPREQSFWMKNTLAPLDIAFFGPDRKLLNVGKGVPHSLDGVDSAGQAQYVLEVRQGTFEKLGIKPGAELKLF